MTTQEKIEVMQAYAKGKKIQSRNCGLKEWADWDDDQEPNWNWELVNFRIKPEAEYRPYKNTDEMIENYLKRFNIRLAEKSVMMPLIWVKNTVSGFKDLIYGFHDTCVRIGREARTMDELLCIFTYLDGSPCGKKEEE